MRRFLCILALSAALSCSHVANAQAPATPATTSGESLPDAPQPTPKEVVLHLPGDVLRDQAAIWTSPAHLRKKDLVWLLPLAAATAASVATDRHTMNDVVSHDPHFNQANINASNALVYGLVALPAGFYGAGLIEKNAHAQETGALGAEAILDGLVVEEGLKFLTWRERPYQDDARGRFYQSSAGIDSSFPSSHSVVAWSTAAVIASEYRSPWAQIGVYSMATGVSLTRVMGQQHFPTDVLIGSAAGWAIGRYVVHRHHTHPAH